MKVKTDCKFILLSLLFFVLFSFLTLAQKYPVEVIDNNIKIKADKEIYYCEPIFKEDKCLVNIGYYIENLDISDKTISIDLDFEQTKENIDVKDWSSGISSVDVKKDDLTNTEDFSIKKGEQKKYITKIWASESGKFNITVNIGGVTTVLDPIINVSINSSFPSYHLINGTNDFDDRDSYENYTEISSGLSDGSASTNYSVQLGQDIYNNRLFYGFTFNEISGGTNNDFSQEDNNAIIVSSPVLTAQGTEYTGIEFDGSTDYSVVITNTDLDATENESLFLCLSFNNTQPISAEKKFMQRRVSTGDGYIMSIKADETVECVVDRGASVSISRSTSSFTDGQWHKMCCYNNATSGEGILYVDGVEVDRDAGATGDIVNTQNMGFGATGTGSSKFEGGIDEACGWKTTENFDPQELALKYNETLCINETEGDSIQVFFNHSIDENETYFIEINSDFTDSHVIRIWTYLNATHVNTTNFMDRVTTGTTTFLPLADIIETGYNNPFRISTINSENNFINGVSLFETFQDNETPVVNSCWWNKPSIGCNEYNMLFCNITDNYGVISATEFLFAPTSTHPNISENASIKLDLFVCNSHWERNHTPSGIETFLDIVNWTYDIPINISVLQVNASDIFENNVTENYAVNEVSFEYFCCNENWVSDSFSCRINNTYILTYTDQNSCGTFGDLPANNGTEQICNYCSEELVQSLGECQVGNIQNVNWTDGNFSTCCSITNLSTDCSILTYPYNETTTQFCQFFEIGLGTPQCPEQFDFKIREKEYCKVNIPINYSNETFKCIVSIYDLDSGNIIQVNPQYRENTGFVGELLYGEQESREYFAPANRIVNFYITNKNLEPDTNYYIEVECCSIQRCLQSEHLFQTGYEGIDWLGHRLIWAKENVSQIVLFFIIVVVLFTLFLIFFIKPFPQ